MRHWLFFTQRNGFWEQRLISAGNTRFIEFFLHLTRFLIGILYCACAQSILKVIAWMLWLCIDYDIETTKANIVGVMGYVNFTPFSDQHKNTAMGMAWIVPWEDILQVAASFTMLMVIFVWPLPIWQCMENDIFTYRCSFPHWTHMLFLWLQAANDTLWNTVIHLAYIHTSCLNVCFVLWKRSKTVQF